MSEEMVKQKEKARLEKGPKWEASAVLLTSPNTKTVHFVRHAEATHNEAAKELGRIAYQNPDFHDARLTPLGKEQCAKLNQTLANDGVTGPDIQLVVVSPCSRATETAILCFQEHVPASVPWLALECLREKTGTHPCDGRRSVTELKLEYGEKIDYQYMTNDADVYGQKLGKSRETDEMIIARAYEFFEWLCQRPETNVLVVTHSAFLAVLFNQVVSCNSDLSRWYENCEMRTTQLAVVEPNTSLDAS
mmetsp:Transcript_50344/g.58168  ORF Transcript_50344/g.58168 Transcript_50344/m.58168 type:complete len:248 (-) Transcript_50344:103-846(-)